MTVGYSASITLSLRKAIIRIFSIAFILIIFTLGFLLGSNYMDTRSKINILFSSSVQLNQDLSKIQQKSIESHSDGQNSTHLWSMPLANENYFRLARLLPCRVVEYKGGPKDEKIDTCSQSATNEFSIHNTLLAQRWLYEHQHPVNCANKRFAIIQKFAQSGFGSTMHQVAWAFGKALASDRIAVYEIPGNWMYGDCNARTPDCFFLPITNCSAPSVVDGNQTIRIKADIGHWPTPILPATFQNRTFNWYRAQLLFYLMRYKPETLAHVKNVIAQQFQPSSIALHHPYIAVYVRRSDKVVYREMSQAYALKEYFDLFDAHAKKANITTVYINSEDEQVFKEFDKINKEKQNYYKLLSINVQRNVVFRSLIKLPLRQRANITLDFLTDLFIEINADLHAGTLTSNWCRLVDEIRLVLGKIIPYYTPENKYLMGMGR